MHERLAKLKALNEAPLRGLEAAQLLYSTLESIAYIGYNSPIRDYEEALRWAMKIAYEAINKCESVHMSTDKSFTQATSEELDSAFKKIADELGGRDND